MTAPLSPLRARLLAELASGLELSAAELAGRLGLVKERALQTRAVERALDGLEREALVVAVPRQGPFAPQRWQRPLSLLERQFLRGTGVGRPIGIFNDRGSK